MVDEIERTSAAAEIGRSSTLRFGGAIGVDSVALNAAHQARRPRHRLIFIVIVPAKLADQPEHARLTALRCADQIIELGFPRGAKWAYLRRNDRLLDGAQRLLAFTDGRQTGGTAYTIERAIQRKLDVQIVRVQSIVRTI